PAPSPASGLEPTFGRQGIAAIDPPHGIQTTMPASLALQPDGKVVVVSTIGRFTDGPGRLVLARYHPGGALDLSFGAGGYAEAGFTPEPALGVEPSRPRGVVQADGKILLGASTVDKATGHLDLGTQRFRSDGTSDSTFGAGGLVRINVGFAAPDGGRIQQSDELKGLALQPDGKILAGGNTFGSPEIGDSFSLARLLPDGSLDET